VDIIVGESLLRVYLVILQPVSGKAAVDDADSSSPDPDRTVFCRVDATDLIGGQLVVVKAEMQETPVRKVLLVRIQTEESIVGSDPEPSSGVTTQVLYTTLIDILVEKLSEFKGFPLCVIYL
jgi:hypothetical protein